MASVVSIIRWTASQTCFRGGLPPPLRSTRPGETVRDIALTVRGLVLADGYVMECSRSTGLFQWRGQWRSLGKLSWKRNYYLTLLDKRPDPRALAIAVLRDNLRLKVRLQRRGPPLSEALTGAQFPGVSQLP